MRFLPKWFIGVLQDCGFLVGFTPFPMDVGIQTCLRTRSGTQACLGRVVARVTGASLVKVSLPVGTCLGRGVYIGLHSITTEGNAIKDDLS